MNVKGIAHALWGTSEEEALLVADEADGSCTIEEIAKRIGDERSAWSAAKELARRDLIEPLVMDGAVDLTHVGQQVANELRRSRARGLARFDAVQRAVLEFVEERPDEGAVSDILETDSATAYGAPFTEAEVGQATDYLVEQGLLKGIPVDQADLVRPQLTPRGRNALHSDSMIRDYAEGTGVRVHDQSNTVNMHGGVVAAFQQGGSGNTMGDVSVTVTADEQRKVLELVRKALDGLGDADEDAPLREQLSEIQGEAEAGQADRPRLLEQAGRAMLLAAATEGGRNVIQWIGELVAHLGN